MPPQIYHRNRTVRVSQTPLIENALEETFLSADIAAASGTLTVKNINGFAVGKTVWINPYSETGEIILVHASTAPTGTTITLASNTVFAHSAGEKVYYIEFNQVEISHAATLTGAKSVLATSALQGDQKEFLYLDISQTTGFYFARFKDSVAATFGSYSDGVTYGGWASNTVGYMVDRALSDLSLVFSDVVTVRDCLEWVNECLKLAQGKLKRWPEHYSYNAVLGQIQRGDNTTTMPSDAYDTETNKSLIKVRVGDNQPLTYLSPGDFDNQLGEAKYTQVTTEATSGQTTLEIDNSYDFKDSGTVNVYISGTKYAITYTGVTRSATAGVLTGVPASGDGSISVTIPVDTWVWQDEIEGIPAWFTVRNGVIEHWPLADASEDNQNLYGDYAKVATSVDSESDTIDLQRFDTVQSYLTWRMKMKARNDGVLDQNDGYYLMYREKLNDAIRTLPSNNVFRVTPSINRIGNSRFSPKRAKAKDE